MTKKLYLVVVMIIKGLIMCQKFKNCLSLKSLLNTMEALFN